MLGWSPIVSWEASWDKLKDSAQQNEEIIGKNPLRFMKFDDAKKFLVWLKEPKPAKKESKSANIGKYKIYLDER